MSDLIKDPSSKDLSIEEKIRVTSDGDEQDDVALQPGRRVITLEEYMYFAAIQRKAEALGGVPGKTSVEDGTLPMTDDQRLRAEASRALRLTSWMSIFYLITTDILGPFNAPYAISQVGWVPGIILYFFMGLAALYTGILIWTMFVKLDSPRYPVRSYADIAERLFGPWSRNLCASLQSLQLLIFVSIICLGNGQALAQVVRGPSGNGTLCFSVCIVIWAILGMVVGQIRTLKAYGWLANSAVWINLLIIFLSMGFVAHSPPNFAAAATSLGTTEGPVETAKFTTLPLFLKVNGIMNMVYAYGGAMIFPEMMAEMRKPMDFWKGMVLAQSLIFSAYVMYGAFVYSFQGQFTLPLAFQGVSKYSWQSVGNVLSLVTAIIAAGLYGNIGLKVVYNHVVQDWWKGPPLMSRKGRYTWSTLVISYWALAFVIGSAIPQVQTISGLIGAIGIMQFTYTFPPLMLFVFYVHTDAMIGDGEFDANIGATSRIDTWRDWSRWRRGLFSGRWYFKFFNLALSLAGLAMACLGMWGAGESIKATFANSGAATSFGCTSPV